MKRAIPVIALTALLALLGGALGNALDQWDRDTADQREAQKTAQREARAIKAMKEICGPGAGYVLTDVPSQFQCTTHKGVIRATKGML